MKNTAGKFAAANGRVDRAVPLAAEQESRVGLPTLVRPIGSADGSSRRGLHAHVVRDLGLRIIRGDFAQGEPLPNEADLSAQLGVSRTVVREAIKVLSGKGLIEVRPKTGTRVRPRDTWNLIDVDVLAWHGELGVDRAVLLGILEVRSMLEPAAARLATRRASAEEIAGLRSVVGRLEASSERIPAQGMTAWQASLESDLEFHGDIIRACHNPVLFQLHQILATGLRETQLHYDGDAAAARYSVPLHRQLLEAVEQRNEDVAEAMMREIIRFAAAAYETA